MRRNTSLGWIRFRSVAPYSETAPRRSNIGVLTPVQIAVKPISQTRCQPDANSEEKQQTTEGGQA